MPLLLAGVAAVLYWHVTEQAGHGDLRPYLLVQFLLGGQLEQRIIDLVRYRFVRLLQDIADALVGRGERLGLGQRAEIGHRTHPVFEIGDRRRFDEAAAPA